MTKVLILSLLLLTIIIASSGCADLNENTTATTELNRTESDTGTGTDSTESEGTSEGGSDSSSKTYFDSGMTTLENGETYEWESYKINENKIIIYSIYHKNDGNDLKQTNTLEKSAENPETVNMITVIPKVTGRSSWQHITGNQGYIDLFDYYWNHFRPKWLMKGPIH